MIGSFSAFPHFSWGKSLEEGMGAEPIVLRGMKHRPPSPPLRSGTSAINGGRKIRERRL